MQHPYFGTSTEDFVGGNASHAGLIVSTSESAGLRVLGRRGSAIRHICTGTGIFLNFSAFCTIHEIISARPASSGDACALYKFKCNHRLTGETSGYWTGARGAQRGQRRRSPSNWGAFGTTQLRRRAAMDALGRRSLTAHAQYLHVRAPTLSVLVSLRPSSKLTCGRQPSACSLAESMK